MVFSIFLQFLKYRSRALRFIFVHVSILLMIGYNAWDQKPYGFYNLREPIAKIGNDLRNINAPECYTTLLSISNVIKNYSAKKGVPNSLHHFISNKWIIPLTANTSTLKVEAFIVAR